MFSSKRIIVAPLFWGLGHATRCIPIIQNLLKKNTVAIASDGEALDLLKAEFPNLDAFELPSYNISYTYDSMLANMIVQGPSSLRTIKKEKEVAKEICSSWNADVIISDNRFGFRCEDVVNVYITHQLKVPANNPFLSKMASRIHQRIISKYDQCWVPDFEGVDSLAGKLSQVNIETPTVYLGAQSRMKKEDLPKLYDFTAVLSGPEPQRSKLEELLLNIFSKSSKHHFCLIRGTATERNLPTVNENIKVYDLLTSKNLNKVMNASSHIICRSGYTSIMDLIQLDKQATLIPTPGQYEQEYLAKRLNGKYNFSVCSQRGSQDYLSSLVAE